MTSQDAQIWTRFLKLHSSLYTRFDYDFKVGSGTIPDPSFPENFIVDFIELTKKRIDAIGYGSSFIELFEVKPRASTSALGQILTYTSLYQSSFPTSLKIISSVVSEFISDDDIKIYKEYDIRYYIV